MRATVHKLFTKLFTNQRGKKWNQSLTIWSGQGKISVNEGSRAKGIFQPSGDLAPGDG